VKVLVDMNLSPESFSPPRDFGSRKQVAPGDATVDRPCTALASAPVTFYRYLESYDVHVLDCAGRVDVAVGLERLRRLSQELEARPANDGVHRLLVDFRHTEWVSEEAHRELSRVTRRDFGLNAENPALRVAFVLCGGKGAVSDSEHWFDDEVDALAWLIGHRAVEEDNRRLRRVLGRNQMDDSDFEGTLVLEKLAAIDKVEDFFDAVDSDDVERATALMKRAGVDAPTIATVVRKMAAGDGEH
jgi:hypothetical protein